MTPLPGIFFKFSKKIGIKNAVNLKVLPLLSAQQNTAVFSFSSRLRGYCRF
jgi:hypothetical protein